MIWQENQGADGADDAADAVDQAADAVIDGAENADAAGGTEEAGGLADIPQLDDVDGWVQYGIELAISIGKVAAILFVTWAISKWVASAIRKRGQKSERLDTTLAFFFANLARWAILAMGVIAAIGVVGIPTASFAAVIAAAGLAVGLALQGSLSNFASGVMLLIFRPFKVGDFVNAAGTAGTVQEIQLFATILDTPDNRRLIVPNGAVFGSTIENVSFHETRRVDVSVGTDYGADSDQVRGVLKTAAEALPQKLADQDVAIVLGELADSSVNWSVRV